jgi:hypothetical protein
MLRKIYRSIIGLLFLLLFFQCKKTVADQSNQPNNSLGYNGTGSITQGLATSSISNLFPAGIRAAGIGTIVSTDNKSWTVPAEVNYNNASFPFASDLYNSYVSGHSYTSATNAIAALNGSDIVTIDNSGQLYTAYIFADNYFEMYVNGIPVGKDAVPYTEFNSSIIRFKVSKPFTLAVKCVDWEEHLGLGTELQGTNTNYVGDGGFVAVIKDANSNIIAVSDSSWKAQTYYTSPITDLNCLTENNNYRLSSNCSTTYASSLSYAVHWDIPTLWYSNTFDDTHWPTATLFSNATVGINNKPSYTNFTDIFDNTQKDAVFIWSTNLLLDNFVLLRKKVE